MKKYYKKFTSKVEMVRSLANLSDKFNTELMVEMLSKGSKRRLYVVEKGKTVTCDNFKKFTRIIAVHGGLDIMYPICFGRGEVYHVYSKTDYFNTETKGDIQEPVEEPTEVLPELDAVEPVEEEIVSEVDTDTPDWEWVDGLENTKENKLALDEYAEKFDIQLKRNKSLANMIRDFKKEYADK